MKFLILAKGFSESEITNPELASFGVNKNVFRFDVSVDQVVLMDIFKRCHELDKQAEDLIS